MKNFSRGFGLVEIMVALVLGLVVSLGIIQIFIASRGTFVAQNASARMQEDARFVLSKLLQELRLAGMYGCLQFDTAVASGAINKPAALNNPILWDVANQTLTLVTADVGTAGTSPTWTVISDCQTTSQLYSGSKAPLAGQTAFPLRQLVYRLNGTDLQMQQFPAGVPGQSQTLLQNVRSLEVSFGLKGQPMTYTALNAPITNANGPDVLSVRIELVMSDPTARVREQQFNVVAYLRNRF
ncbi:prepilin-type N-terminal cleavage/methylation domain-containing protein [Pseudomonas sp. JDS28PS106]|uniref:PilW family protein n=1 Tax=Pseudomonas sp. JDS28PS106 TaxID=2497235 RepID=UPI002FD700B9